MARRSKMADADAAGTPPVAGAEAEAAPTEFYAPAEQVRRNAAWAGCVEPGAFEEDGVGGMRPARTAAGRWRLVRLR